MTTDRSAKVRENRARRAAARQGMSLQKSRRRDPRAVDHGGYMLLNLMTNGVVAGGYPIAYGMTLEDVENFLDNQLRTIDVKVNYTNGDGSLGVEHGPTNFDASHTPMLDYNDSYPVGGGRHAGWVLFTWDEESQGVDEYFVGWDLTTVDKAVEDARQHLRMR